MRTAQLRRRPGPRVASRPDGGGRGHLRFPAKPRPPSLRHRAPPAHQPPRDKKTGPKAGLRDVRCATVPSRLRPARPWRARLRSSRVRRLRRRLSPSAPYLPTPSSCRRSASRRYPSVRLPPCRQARPRCTSRRFNADDGAVSKHDSSALTFCLYREPPGGPSTEFTSIYESYVEAAHHAPLYSQGDFAVGITRRTVRTGSKRTGGTMVTAVKRETRRDTNSS